MNREGYPLPKTLLALNKPLQIEVVYFRGHLAVIITTREGVALPKTLPTLNNPLYSDYEPAS